MGIIKTYYKALRWGIDRCPTTAPEQHRAFASAVAQLCCDDPREPLNKRERSLFALLKISGGPSTREHACLWAAYKRGDAVQSLYAGMTSFYVDERFQMPGTWTFEFACKFCEAIAFGDITALHREVWRTEPNIYNDAAADIAAMGFAGSQALPLL